MKNLLESTSNELFSGKFYHDLNNDDGLTVYYPDCISLGPVYKDTKSRSLRILCAQLVKYLKTTYTTLNKGDLKYDDCILLNYWIYSRLVNILGTEDKTVIAPILGELIRIWNSIVANPLYTSPYNKCMPDSIIPTQNDWRKRKELYDYCVNYDTIKNTLPYFDHMCPKYWNYVESHTSLFKYFETLCSKSSDQCPEFYNECNQYDPNVVLRTFSCNETMAKKKAEETSEKDKLQLQGGRSAGQEANHGMRTNPEFSSGGSHLTRDGTHPATQTGNILLGVVATSITSGALYRYNEFSDSHVQYYLFIIIVINMHNNEYNYKH
ncbi:hypothetical protein PVNG_05881 [Plasmodium vivax North Korean]|uniref:Variable surface protein Vir4 n=1 Tax=Plasmodium vivax North Korean TaxID=1035514 RepID=A0A0J9W6F4_PLAVI|nr:hypothetical protein PVNG_05881 [Plasmodium vivax North Korean]